MIRQPPRSTLFPDPTLFRSVQLLLEPKPVHARLGRDRQRALVHLDDAVKPGEVEDDAALDRDGAPLDRKSTRLNSSHANISYAVFCLKKKKTRTTTSR